MSMLMSWGRQLVAELGLVTRQDLDDARELINRKLEGFMADVSPILTTLAGDLKSFAEGPFAALLAENAQLKADNAALISAADTDAAADAAEDAREDSAAAAAVDAFNALANPVTTSPEVPVEVPVVGVPETPEPSPELPIDTPAETTTGETTV